MDEFKKLGLSENVLKVLHELGYEKPTEIQSRTISLVLEGKDVIGNAATGSGKTLAFASGLIEKTVPGKGIQGLVMAPTRELVVQIAKVIRNFAKNSNLVIEEIYGGVNIDRQIRGVRNADIIVGTPGRILDHLNRKTFDFMDLKILVLDEADRMVDMGFLPDVERIITSTPKTRQTLLFSATTSQDVLYIEKKYMKEPKTVSVEQYIDSSKLRQYYYDTPSHLKFSLLVHLLKQEKSGIIIVFCNTRKNVDLVSMNLERYKIRSVAIHGGLDQKKRSRIMEQFQGNRANILICTDVAARGLDIKDVSHVYNYDIPKMSKEYIHRIGRTARAGKEGLAVSIVTSRDYDNFRKVMEDDSLNIEVKEMPKIEKLNPNFGDKGYGRDKDRVGGDRRGSYRRGPESGRGYGKKRAGGSRSSRVGHGGGSRGGPRSSGPSRSGSRGSHGGGSRGRHSGNSRRGQGGHGSSRSGPRDSNRKSSGRRNHGRR